MHPTPTAAPPDPQAPDSRVATNSVNAAALDGAPDAALGAADVRRPGRTTAFTARAVVLGLLAVALLAAAAPVNDLMLANTRMVGSYLPAAAILVTFVLGLVNIPLRRVAPAWALSTGEMALVLSMLLVGGSVLFQGLLLSIVPMPVFPLHFAGTSPVFGHAFRDMGLPTWLWPTGGSLAPNHPNVTAFYGRLPAGEPIPWRDWAPPVLGWGTFAVAMLTALVAQAALVRRQWQVNERLPFPLARLQLSLIEQPEPGRLVGPLFRSTAFWVALGAVFFIHLTNIGALYLPRYIVPIPRGFDLRNVLNTGFLEHLPTELKRTTLYFSLVGVACFLRTRVTLSLWLLYVLLQLTHAQFAVAGLDVSRAVYADQQVGAGLAIFIGLLWIGRAFWKTAVLEALWLRKPAPDSFLSAGASLRIVAGAAVVMFVWLLVVGVSAAVAAAAIAFVLVSHLLVTRFVAETGMPFMRSSMSLSDTMTYLHPSAYTSRDVFFGGIVTILGAFSTRESATTHTAHALALNDAAYDQSAHPSPDRRRRLLLPLLGLSVLVSLAVGGASSLAVHYRVAAPLSVRAASPIENPGGMIDFPTREVTERVRDHAELRPVARSHSPALHVAVGAVIAGTLQGLTWRFAGWPIVPMGFWACNSWYMSQAWFSLFLGWLVKSLLVRFGGSSMIATAHPVFVGIILGEILAAAFSIVLNVALALAGLDFVSGKVTI